MSETITTKAVTFQQIKPYLPCEVYRKDMNKCIPFTGFTDMGEDAGRLTDDEGKPQDEILLVSGFAAKWSMKAFIEKGCRLMLRKLASMTKEEALEIAKLAIPYTGRYEILDIKRTSFIISLPFINAKYQVFPARAFSIQLEKFNGQEIIKGDEMVTIHNPALVFQYLISKKFDIGLLPKESYVIIDEKNGGFDEPE